MLFAEAFLRRARLDFLTGRDCMRDSLPMVFPFIKILQRVVVWLSASLMGATLLAGPATDPDAAKQSFMDYWSALRANDTEQMVNRLHPDFRTTARKQVVDLIRGRPVAEQGALCRQWFQVENIDQLQAMDPKACMLLAARYSPLRKALKDALLAQIDAPAITADLLKAGECNLRIPASIPIETKVLRVVLKIHLLWSEENGWQIASFDKPERVPEP